MPHQSINSRINETLMKFKISHTNSHPSPLHFHFHFTSFHLLGRPLIQLDRQHKRDMSSKRPMNPRALSANKTTDINARPRWINRRTIGTNLILLQTANAFDINSLFHTRARFRAANALRIYLRCTLFDPRGKGSEGPKTRRCAVRRLRH